MVAAVRSDLRRIAVFAETLRGELTATLARGALRIAQEAAGELSAAVIRLFTKNPTGSLARSFEPRLVEIADEVVAAEAVSRLPYARIQDEGGVIKPRTRKMLAIPHPLGNVPRGKWPRDFPAGKLVRFGRVLGEPMTKRTAKGTAGPAQLTGIKPKFILAKQVRIAGKRYVAVAHAALMPRLPEIVTPELAAALEISMAAGRSTGGRDA